jgi:hypothetical protein
LVRIVAPLLRHQPILVRKYPEKLAERHAIGRKKPFSGSKRFFSEPWFGFCIFLPSAHSLRAQFGTGPELPRFKRGPDDH